jgi:hypothetical protein
MNIRFPETSEAELFEAMESRAVGPWRWRAVEAGSPMAGYVCFHRDQVGEDRAATVCLWREAPGNLAVVAIVPDESAELEPMPVDEYVRILRAFDAQIAEPAAESVGGITSIDADKRSLEDYFSRESVRLLERFCKTSNAADGGCHPSDQEKWVAFLLHVHESGSDVPADTFAACLRAAEWWPEERIATLVTEFELAMRLLRHYDGPRRGAAGTRPRGRHAGP